jgi:hypothetical protein
MRPANDSTPFAWRQHPDPPPGGHAQRRERGDVLLVPLLLRLEEFVVAQKIN